MLPYEDTNNFDLEYEEFKKNGEKVKIRVAVESLDEIKEVDESEEMRVSARAIPNTSIDDNPFKF
jgi:hypothetical protein